MSHFIDITTGNEPSLSLSPHEKQNIIWNALLQQAQKAENADTTATSTPTARHWPTYSTVWAEVANASYHEILTCPDDWHPGYSRHPTSINDETADQTTFQQRRKTLCPHGVIGCVQMELFPFPSNQADDELHAPYTGLLTPGRTIETCILRLSSAIKPPQADLNNLWWGPIFLHAFAGPKLRHAKLFPTAALKVFRSLNQPSGNLLLGGCKVGQSEEDFFAHCLCNHMTERMPRTVQSLVQPFYRYSSCPLSLGLSDFCTDDPTMFKKTSAADSIETKGQINFPFALIFYPRYSIASSRSMTAPHQHSETASTPKSFDSFVEDLLAIPVGTVLYDMYACPDPKSVTDPTKLQRIGRIVTTSQMIRSTPDDGIFFRHQRKEDDYELRPDWQEQAIHTTVMLGKFRGTAASLAGWELFEAHIASGTYVDFEKLANPKM